MILYVNGDSHTAAAEAVNPHAFAEDDGSLGYLGRLPHPDNLAVSWGTQLSQTLKYGLQCDAESASSNARILRVTREWLETSGWSRDKLLVVIQWSTWEREEWLHNGTYYQVGASGLDHVPPELQEKYRNYVIGTDWKHKTQQAHEEIWRFHLQLKSQQIRHVFFNGNNDFSQVSQQKNWGNNYIGPYDPKLTYNSIIRAQGIDTVAPNSWHFGKDGHDAWHRYLLNHLIQHNFI
jgi:hypothetical protein